ncbi:MAG TPA: hypothetical protein P5185_09340 [Oscillospiraceae bacterium]|nr:hypothetical protein [Oscillospiraceae bacterium]
MKNQSIHSILIEVGNLEDLDFKVGDKLWIGPMSHLGEAEIVEAEFLPTLDATIVVRYEEAPEETSELRYRDLCGGDSYLRVYSA